MQNEVQPAVVNPEREIPGGMSYLSRPRYGLKALTT